MNPLLINPRPKKQVSLTALVDVVFILLFFFMLTSSFSKNNGFDLQSPVASHETTLEKPQLIELHEDGSLTLLGKESTFQLTDSALLESLNTHKPTVILPNAKTQVQSIVSAMERLNRLGFQTLSLGQSLKQTANKNG